MHQGFFLAHGSGTLQPQPGKVNFLSGLTPERACRMVAGGVLIFFFYLWYCSAFYCKDMNIVDVVEMLVDWKAATLRHNDGNILKSLESNMVRFELDKVSLYDILLNSVGLLEEHNS